MTPSWRLHIFSRWRARNGAPRWLAWVAGAMVVGLSLAAALLVAYSPGVRAEAASPPPFQNDLATAPSPYLRSAAQQPVAWQQWGPRAFALAVALERPIWLDIGAIWCQWCHVMDREGPKFPVAEALRLALAAAFLTDDTALQRAVLHTLNAYAASGMRDHLHGGFFRYSMDRALTVPHFEKMDYVQAALLQAYLDAYRLTGNAAYAEVARDIMRYVNDSLLDRARGGFYAHQDADVSLDDDGSYYTWSLVQLRATLAPDLAEALRLAYGVEAPGEMRHDPSQNVLRLVRTPAEVAQALGIAEDAARRRLQEGRRALAAARRRQRAPLVEQTKFTNRNAMMISAYLDAAVTLRDTTARDIALQSLDFLLATAVQPDGHVRHATAETTSYVDGLLADYIGLADALLDAFQVRGRPQDLQMAERIVQRALKLFWDQERGGFYDRQADPTAPALLADRQKAFADTPLPGDNAVAARALDKLYLLTSQERWRERTTKTLAAFAGAAREQGTFVGTYGLVLQAHLRKPPQVVIMGPHQDHGTQALAAAAWRTYRPGRLVVTYDPSTVASETLPPAVAGAARVFQHEATPRAYVCVGETCAPPTSAPDEVSALVRDYGRRGRP